MNLQIHRSLNYLLNTITEAINTPVRAPRTPITIHHTYSSNLAATRHSCMSKVDGGTPKRVYDDTCDESSDRICKEHKWKRKHDALALKDPYQ